MSVLQRASQAAGRWQNQLAHLFQKQAQQVFQKQDLAPSWVFLGPPGVGKGTYCSRMSEALGIPHIAAGDLVREEISNKTDVGLQVCPGPSRSTVQWAVCAEHTGDCIAA